MNNKMPGISNKTYLDPCNIVAKGYLCGLYRKKNNQYSIKKAFFGPLCSQ